MADDSAEREAAEREKGAEQPSADPTTAEDPTTDLGPPPRHEPRYGAAGRPLSRRSPFMIGFLGGVGVLVAYSAFLAVRNALGVLILISIALFIAVALNPAVVALQRVGLRRGFAVAVVASGVVLLFCGGFFALLPPLIGQSVEFAENLPGYIAELRRNESLAGFNERFDILERLEGAATTSNITRALGGVLGGAQLVFGTFLRVLTVFVLTLYFMIAFDRIKHGAYKLVPASRRQRVELITDEILSKVGAYMVGALAIALLAGSTTFVFLVIMGVAYPFALAFVVAIFDLIPQIGATLGAVVVTVVGAATSIPVGITCLVFFLIYQQVENYLIYPHVMRRSVKVSNVAAIVAALLGVSLLGVVGALIAIPAVAAIQLIGHEVILPRQARH